MYFDFNIPYDPVDDRLKHPDRIRLILARFSECESVVALNHTIDHVDPKKIQPIQPFATATFKHPVTQLTRVTVETDQPLDDATIALLHENYQLVALRTSDPCVFEAACQSYNIDIISMDCSKRLPFRLNHMLVKEAIRRGIYFEITYGPGIQDNTQRAYVLQMSKEVVSATHAENLIVSSEANDVSNIRAPFDVYHFLKSIGLPNDKAKFATGKNGEALIKRLRKA